MICIERRVLLRARMNRTRLYRYWFDATSGFHYNETTQLYYHAETGIYYRWDLQTNSK